MKREALAAMASLQEQELAELDALDRLKDKYDWADDDKTYLKRKKDIERAYSKMSTQRKVLGGAALGDNEKGPRKLFEWENSKKMKLKDFDEAYNKLGEIFKETGKWSGDNPRGGNTSVKGCSIRFKRWVLEAEDKDNVHVRVLELTDGNFVFQLGKEVTRIEEDDDLGEEEEEAAEEAAQQPSAAKSGRSKASNKKKAAAEEESGAGAASGAAGKRSKRGKEAQ